MDIASYYNKLGGVYDDKGEYDLALEYYFKCLKIRETKLGNEHVDTARSYNNIGLVYDNKGEYNLALEYYFKSLKIKKIKLGNDHV